MEVDAFIENDAVLLEGRLAGVMMTAFHAKGLSQD
jgi:hypothetical protein